jgi:hypothetical protein
MKMASVLQDWVQELPFMQQSVLLTSVRGPDNTAKYHDVKYLLRWLRRCVLISAFTRTVLDNPYTDDGGSFTGQSFVSSPQDENYWEGQMNNILHKYIKTQDELPFHFQIHFIHAAEILGYKHPNERIAKWWRETYFRLVECLHLHPESKEEMELRLSDIRENWLKRTDDATKE